MENIDQRALRLWITKGLNISEVKKIKVKRAIVR